MTDQAQEILKSKQKNLDKGNYSSYVSKSATDTQNSSVFTARLFGLEHDIWSCGLCLWSI